MMRNLILASAAAAFLAAMGTSAMSQSNNNANANAPGQDRTCLVTTGTPGSFNDADVTETKWLPRKAAEQQASKNPGTMRVFEYDNDPLVGEGKQYATAEELCTTHFN